VVAYIGNEDITNGELLKIMKGPDFPTAAIITGREGIKNYFETGRGSITTRARTEIEEAKGGKQAIIINELPYQVNKATLLKPWRTWCGIKRWKAFPTSGTNPTGTGSAW
jgi:DNA gyrase subunit A